MSNSVLSTIADAVKTTLNAATLSQTFTAVRSWFPIKKLEEYGTDIHVFIYPDNISNVEIQSRNYNKKQYSIIVTLGKKITAAETVSNTDVDPLVLLAEEIEALLFHADLVNPSGQLVAFCDSSKYETLANIETLNNDSRVFSAITFTFTDYQEQV